MGTTLAILGAGAAVGAGGSMLAADQGQSDFQVGDTALAGAPDPRADPLQAALRNEALLSLGRTPDRGVLLQSAPSSRLLSNARQGVGTGDFRRDDLGMIGLAVGALQESAAQAVANGEGVRGAIRRFRQRIFPGSGPDTRLIQLMQDAGFSDLFSLVNQEMQFREEIPQRLAELQAVAPDVLAGRNAARRGISELQQDFPVATREELDRRIQEARDARIAEINLSQERARDAILQAANVGGFNPAGALGRLGERRLVEEEQATDESINRAIQILAGEVGLGQSSLGTLQSSLRSQEQSSRATGANALQALLQAGSINSGLASDLAGFSAQTEAQKARARKEGIQGATGSVSNLLTLGGLTGGFQNLGALTGTSSGPGAS